MKKITSLLIVFIFILSVCVLPVQASNEIKIMIDEKYLITDDIPIIINGRTLIPVRAVVEELGARVDWNDKNNVITITKGDTTVLIKVNNKVAIVNGSRAILDVPAQIINSRTMIPLRFVVESLGAKVTFYKDTVILLSDINTDFITSMEIIDGKNSEQFMPTLIADTLTTNTQTTEMNDNAKIQVTEIDDNITITSPVRRNEFATVTFKGKANTEYSIDVFYSTVISVAKGLEDAISDSDGKVTWTWKVGSRTKAGSFRVVIQGDGKVSETKLTVIN